jgi:hypothetical protein
VPAAATRQCYEPVANPPFAGYLGFVGHRGWIGIYLDSDVPEDDVAGAIEDAFLAVTPKSLLKSQDLGDAG